MFFAKNKKTKTLLVGITLALSASLFVGGCGSKQQSAQQQGTQVKAMQVIQQDTPISSEFAGKIVGKDEIKVQSKVSGRIVEKYVTGGQYVEAGQPLYKIDSRQYESAVLQANATLAQSEANLSNAQQDLARYQQLLNDTAIAEQKVSNQQATVNAYDAAAAANAALLRKAQQDLDDTVVYAPVSGQLAVDDVAVGTFSTAGNTTLVTIGTSDPVYAQFSISEQDYLKFANSASGVSPQVSITLADGTVYPLDGQIVESDRALGQNTGTLTLKALFGNPENLLLPGMFARVRMIGEVVPNAILVPQRAVQQLLGKSFVMVVNGDGKSEARTVTLGDKVGSYYIVKDGLTPADLVVVEGLSSLREGVNLNVTTVTAEDMGFSMTTDMSEFNSSEIAAAGSKQ